MIKVAKSIVKQSTSADGLKEALEHCFERISNRVDRSFNDEYPLCKILKSDTVKRIAKKYGQECIVILEIVGYSSGKLLIYNRFNKHAQTELDIYRQKEIQ